MPPHHTAEAFRVWGSLGIEFGSTRISIKEITARTGHTERKQATDNERAWRVPRDGGPAAFPVRLRHLADFDAGDGKLNLTTSLESGSGTMQQNAMSVGSEPIAEGNGGHTAKASTSPCCCLDGACDMQEGLDVERADGVGEELQSDRGDRLASSVAD